MAAGHFRFGDRHVMALAEVLSGFVHLPCRAASAIAIFGPRKPRSDAHTLTAQMTYDPRRLHLNGLIHRLPKIGSSPI